MGKPRGFIERGREGAPERPVAERLGDFHEVYGPHEPAHLMEQAARCMDCGVPFCQQGCPLGNQIPDWNDLVTFGRWQTAHVRLASTNNFPEFTGRLCPAPCEAACTLAINQDAVTIEEVEKQIIERAFAEGWVRPRPPRVRTGRHVAVVGSGPAGLAAAAQLNQAGHKVTVYERDDRIGGLLRYGIPDFKMEKSVIDRRVAIMEAEGIEFVTGADVGGNVSFSELKVSHDAVVLCLGSRVPRDLDVPGRDLTGVHFAMDYLEAQNRLVAGDDGVTPISARGKHVVILGGGDTGSDCLGTALRQDAASVTQVELLPRPPERRDDLDNPWPQWPVIFRTSSSQKEGGDRVFALMTTHLTGEGGKVTELHAKQVEVIREGHRTRLEPVEGSETTMKADMVLLAMGYTGPETEALSAQLGVELDTRGNIAVDDHFATSVDGVFAAGDAQRGQSLIVWAISDGRECARGVDAWLRGTTQSALPTRGMDRQFA